MQENSKKQIYINLPVSDLEKSTKFYEALGFVKNPMFSNSDASGMMWSDNIYLMLLTHNFANNFIDNGKVIPDYKKNVSGMFCLSLESKEKVDEFAKKASENGGRTYTVDLNQGSEGMYGKSVEDPDGHIWEPMFMDLSKFTPNH